MDGYQVMATLVHICTFDLFKHSSIALIRCLDSNHCPGCFKLCSQAFAFVLQFALRCVKMYYKQVSLCPCQSPTPTGCYEFQCGGKGTVH